ncbi:MAG: Ni,Fe-hydrogenase III large subunit [Betaproteobacteria bacterium]|nr:Ni,Fe-hydrogenase III large subunit [Betaproteobacteria bacterium]
MVPDELELTWERLRGAVSARRATVDAAQWRAGAEALSRESGRLVALWGSDRRDLGEGFDVQAAFAVRDGLLVLRLPVPALHPAFPDISAFFPVAGRMQRALHDMLGIVALGAHDSRPWLRHGAWPPDVYPLRRDLDAATSFPASDAAYEFVSVSGEGVHEIPVGPVHAGTIEPGHFRFSVLGERVMRLEEHLGYKHKGIEKRFESMRIEDGARLAGRVSGDSTVAYAWAYAMAVEGAAGVEPPARALWLRGLALERERVANHLGDLGYIGNDAGLGFALSQFSRLKEDWLRLNAAVFGHRYAMDFVVPGGVASDVDSSGIARLEAQADRIEREVRALRDTFEEHAGLQDRFRTCGIVTTELAVRLGLTGLAGRASGRSEDLRADLPSPPYDQLDVQVARHGDGDVAARVSVRFDEILESLRLMRLILDRLPAGALTIGCPDPAPGASGLGWVEGWRGEVFVALECAPGRGIRRCHPHDPSWQNWPLLEHAILGNIVPDFPLINKSFNLSYAGVDL